jgi:RNA 2',3'-cyclic 3'-phosphodiesterase
MKGVPTMRAFCALNLDIASVRRLDEIARSLRALPVAPLARWVPPTRMHVTLKFLGDVDIGLASAIGEALVPIAESEPAPRVGYARLSGFPEAERARVVVALLDNAEGAVRRLAARVDEAVGKLGFETEDREYRPHVTLARLPGPTDVTAWLASGVLPADPVTLTELVFYRSDSAADGHEYVALSRFELKAPGHGP